MLRTSANQDYFYDILETCTGTPTSLLPSAHGATPSPASPSAQEAAAAGILPGLGVPIEGHHTETGPGVYETALAYCEAGRMADNAVLFKLAAKSVGLKYGIMPTFSESCRARKSWYKTKPCELIHERSFCFSIHSGKAAQLFTRLLRTHPLQSARRRRAERVCTRPGAIPRGQNRREVRRHAQYQSTRGTVPSGSAAWVEQYRAHACAYCQWVSVARSLQQNEHKQDPRMFH